MASTKKTPKTPTTTKATKKSVPKKTAKAKNPDTEEPPKQSAPDTETLPKKSHYWTFELYPDNVRHLQYIVEIRSGKYPDVTAILHDKDSTKDDHEGDESFLQRQLTDLALAEKLRFTKDYVGVIATNTPESQYKKPHVHCIIRFPYSVFKGSVEKRFPNLESNLIQAVTNPPIMYRYLVHKDDPDKYQYSPNEVFGNTAMFFQYYFANETLPDFIAVPMILDILEDWDWSQGKPTYGKVIRICCEQGLYGHLRQGGALLSNVIKETIADYQRRFDTEEMLERSYVTSHMTDEIYRLNVALKRANETIETYQKITKK